MAISFTGLASSPLIFTPSAAAVVWAASDFGVAATGLEPPQATSTMATAAIGST